MNILLRVCTHIHVFTLCVEREQINSAKTALHYRMPWVYDVRISTQRWNWSTQTLFLPLDVYSENLHRRRLVFLVYHSVYKWFLTKNVLKLNTLPNARTHKRLVFAALYPIITPEREFASAEGASEKILGLFGWKMGKFVPKSSTSLHFETSWLVGYKFNFTSTSLRNLCFSQNPNFTSLRNIFPKSAFFPASLLTSLLHPFPYPSRNKSSTHPTKSPDPPTGVG